MSIFDRHFDKYSYFCYNPIKINHKRSLMRKEKHAHQRKTSKNTGNFTEGKGRFHKKN